MCGIALAPAINMLLLLLLCSHTQQTTHSHRLPLPLTFRQWCDALCWWRQWLQGFAACLLPLLEVGGEARLGPQGGLPGGDACRAASRLKARGQPVRRLQPPGSTAQDTWAKHAEARTADKLWRSLMVASLTGRKVSIYTVQVVLLMVFELLLLLLLLTSLSSHPPTAHTHTHTCSPPPSP